jgi:hypothetical protein
MPSNPVNIILTGDLKCPDIRWDILTVTGPDREIQQGLVDIIVIMRRFFFAGTS